MKTQKEFYNFLKKQFEEIIVSKKNILAAYRYNDNRARDVIKYFKEVVTDHGLSFSNCYHANGIGNNNEYTIFVEAKDADGFVIQKNIATFYYCYGIYGGCSVLLKDLATGEKITVGKAR